MLNSVLFNGRLVKDPELRYTPEGTPVVNFTVAVQRNFKNDDGSYDADFINCVGWRGTAEAIGNHLSKGNLMGVRGRLQSRSYENNGIKVFVTEVVVEEFSFLEKRYTETVEESKNAPEIKQYQSQTNYKNNRR